MANKFEELLDSIIKEDGDDRKVALELGEKYPELRDGWLRQDDFSRKHDALKKERGEFQEEQEQHKVELADLGKFRDYHQEMNGWWEKNWVKDAYGDDKGATKRELEKDKLIGELQEQIQVGGDVTFEDLKKEVHSLMDEQKFISQDSLDKTFAEKETGVKELLEQNITGLSHLITRAPQLAVRHAREFGEDLDIEKLVTYANENKISDISKAYDGMVEPKVKEREAKALETRIKTEREEARAEALKEVGMSSGKLPVDTEGAEMGHFQRFLDGQGKEKSDKGERVVPDEVEFGRGAVGRYAAAEHDKRAAEASAA